MALEAITVNSVTPTTYGCDVNATFTYNSGQVSTQTVAMSGITDLPSLQKSLKQYFRAWRLGRKAAVATPSDVTAVMGQAQSVAANDPDA